MKKRTNSIFSVLRGSAVSVLVLAGCGENLNPSAHIEDAERIQEALALCQALPSHLNLETRDKLRALQIGVPHDAWPSRMCFYTQMLAHLPPALRAAEAPRLARFAGEVQSRKEDMFSCVNDVPTWLSECPSKVGEASWADLWRFASVDLASDEDTRMSPAPLDILAAVCADAEPNSTSQSHLDRGPPEGKGWLNGFHSRLSEANDDNAAASRWPQLEDLARLWVHSDRSTRSRLGEALLRQTSTEFWPGLAAWHDGLSAEGVPALCDDPYARAAPIAGFRSEACANDLLRHLGTLPAGPAPSPSLQRSAPPSPPGHNWQRSGAPRTRPTSRPPTSGGAPASRPNSERPRFPSWTMRPSYTRDNRPTRPSTRPAGVTPTPNRQTTSPQPDAWGPEHRQDRQRTYEEEGSQSVMTKEAAAEDSARRLLAQFALTSTDLDQLVAPTLRDIRRMLDEIAAGTRSDQPLRTAHPRCTRAQQLQAARMVVDEVQNFARHESGNTDALLGHRAVVLAHLAIQRFPNEADGRRSENAALDADMMTESLLRGLAESVNGGPDDGGGPFRPVCFRGTGARAIRALQGYYRTVTVDVDVPEPSELLAALGETFRESYPDPTPAQNAEFIRDCRAQGARIYRLHSARRQAFEALITDYATSLED